MNPLDRNIPKKLPLEKKGESTKKTQEHNPKVKTSQPKLENTNYPSLSNRTITHKKMSDLKVEIFKNYDDEVSKIRSEIEQELPKLFEEDEKHIGESTHSFDDIPPKDLNISIETLEAIRKNPKQSEEILEKFIEETNEKEPVISPNSSFKQIENDLEKLKYELGGSPHYGDKKPTLFINKKFLGKPILRWLENVNRAVNNNWFPKFLWKFLAKFLYKKAYGVEPSDTTISFTKYEYISLAIQRYTLLEQHKKWSCFS